MSVRLGLGILPPIKKGSLLEVPAAPSISLVLWERGTRGAKEDVLSLHLLEVSGHRFGEHLVLEEDCGLGSGHDEGP